jgi:hypothetical protein
MYLDVSRAVRHLRQREDLLEQSSKLCEGGRDVL